MNAESEPKNTGENPFSGVNMGEVYWGAWVPVSRITSKEQSLHKALKPHVRDIRGEPSVPARLANRLTNPK